MSTWEYNQHLILAKELDRACRITLYGLHYFTDWDKLINKFIILEVLELNDTLGIFDDVQVQCLQDVLNKPIFGCCN